MNQVKKKISLLNRYTIQTLAVTQFLSDPGYSTMTPHDDSDHACFTLVEPLIDNKCSNQSIPDSASFNTEPPSSSLNFCQNAGIKSLDGFSSPTKTQCGQTSDLASPHHIQAPVTVHHPMEFCSN